MEEKGGAPLFLLLQLGAAPSLERTFDGYETDSVEALCLKSILPQTTSGKETSD